MSPLLILILIPLVTAFLVIIGLPARRICLMGCGLNLILCLYLFLTYRFEEGGYQFTSMYPILPGVGLNFTLGADGLSLVLLLLSTLVSFTAILVTPPIGKNENWFYVCLLFISTGAIGAFASLDIVFFYAFHELALIPTFLLIGIWGSEEKKAAAWKITLYLAIGSFILLLGIIGLYCSVPIEWRSFDMRTLQKLGFQGLIYESSWVYLLLMLGFGTLVSLFPFHSWAPSAYAAAPTPAAMLHAGVLKKFGLYGILRLVVPLFPIMHTKWATLFLILIVGNLIFIGMATLAQKRLDTMLGYSSVMHMGYIFLGLAAGNILGLTGAAILMFAHGLSIAALFALCGELKARLGTVEFHALGGLAQKMPHMGILFGLAGLASIGVPGFANFVGELMVFFGAFGREITYLKWGRFQIADALIIWGIVLSAVYFLRAYRSIFFGTCSQLGKEVADIRPAVQYAVILLLLALMVVGFYPQPLIQMIAPSLICP